MADDSKIKYEDLIQADGSIEKLIQQLEQLNTSYGTMINAVRAGAKQIVYAMKEVSGATSEGKAKIDEAAASASRLERAERELKFALSDTGKQVAWLKAQTSDANKSTVAQQRAIAALATSYNRIKLEMQDNINLWKSLTDAERADANYGGVVLQNIINLRSQLSALDAQLKPTVQSMTELQKAEQRLVYLQSEEGQRLIEVKRQISDILSGRKQEKVAIDELADAQEKLMKAQSAENVQLQELRQQTIEANRIAKLTAQLNTSALGSYDQLAAKYALNKIKLNAMSAEERNATEAGKQLEQETLALYKQMIHLQEATGNHRLSVGNYAKTWNGLGNSVNQVVREIPAAAVSINTFFLAISNNIPIVIDEIQRLKEKNELLRAEGRPTKNIIKTICASLFSWQTALILVITALSMNGKAILQWIGRAVGIKPTVMEASEAINNITKELEETNGSFGQNVVTVKRLSEEWKNLKTTAEKNQWIRDNATEWSKLDLQVKNVVDAERIFVKYTDTVIKALEYRAKATAAQKLAEKEYEKALVSRAKAEKEYVTDKKTGKKTLKEPSVWDKIKTWFVRASLSTTDEYGVGPSAANLQTASQISARDYQKDRIKELEEEADVYETNGNAYFDMATDYEKGAKKLLEAIGIEEYHKDPKKTRTSHREPRDLTDTINKNEISIQKQYEASITQLYEDEYAKRKKQASDEIANENSKLREMYRKNEVYVKNVDGKYKALTESQKKQIAQQQEWITKTIANNLTYLDKQIKQILLEQKAASTRTLREDLSGFNTSASDKQAGDTTTSTTSFQVSYDEGEREKSIAKERKLMQDWLQVEYQLVIDQNAKLLEAGDDRARSEEEITAEYQKKMLELWAKYDQQILAIRQQNIENQLELVKKGSQEELDLLLQQNEVARQLAISQNAAKPAAQQQSTADINRSFDKKAAIITGTFQLTGFDQAQAQALAEFNIVKHNQEEITKFTLEQEKARWQKQLELAKSGGLDWSDAQIATAEATIKKIDREISESGNTIKMIGEKGLGGTLLTKLGLNDDQIGALEDAANIVLENLQSIAEAEVELAEIEVEKAQERVEAAQSAYDAEVEARNNGYANSVATAKKELQQEKQNELAKEKLLQQAQKRQEAINTVVQASSLITASANLWQSFSSIPIVGPALAIAAIAAMWTSFAVAKVKAAQVTKAQSQQYGEGGLEFLEGGSHASGNDIDLQTKNSKGKNMRAEGGEAMAIINRRSTRRYRKQLPSIVNSLNKGTFEDKYGNAFSFGETVQHNINQTNQVVDLAKLEKEVQEIRKQNEQKYYVLPNGSVVEIKHNIKRILR